MKQVSVISFPTYLNNSGNDPLIVIHGEERFFFDLILHQIEKSMFKNKADRDLNFHVFYGSDDSVSDILSACLAYPMLAGRKLVIVKDFDKLLIPDKDSFVKYIANPQSTTTLVLLINKLGTTKFHNDILKNAVSVKCGKLKDGEIYSWCSSKFDEVDLKVNKESIAFLIENIGADLLRLNLEVEKIKSYLEPGELLTLEKISQITGFTREVNIFNFQKVLAAKNLSASLKIGHYLIEQGESLAAILPMIFNFFRKIWVIKQLSDRKHSKSQILSLLKTAEFAYRDAFGSYAAFSYPHLELIFEKLLESEIQLKTTQKSPESILTILCYYICNFKKN
jgi:DNA polymerase-3 subunit delta